MKSVQKLIVFTILMLGSHSVFSQEKGAVYFFVEVDNGYFEIEINDTMLLKRYKDSLPAGDYKAKVWSPGYVVTTIDFSVAAGKATEKHVKMVKNNNFMQYERDYKDYRMKFHKRFTLPLSISLASTLTTGVFMVRAYDLKRDIEDDIVAYYNSPSTKEIDQIKIDISEKNLKYNRNRNAYYVGLGVSAFCIGGTVWSFINFNKNNTEPTYFKESPFKDRYSFNITPFGCRFVLHI